MERSSAPAGETEEPGASKYIPPSLRDGGVNRTNNLNMQSRDATAIRITNLSESTTQTDLEDLLKPFGPIQKRYLAKHKRTGLCKGFAYVHFKFRNDAAKAITMLNGHCYDNHILIVNWTHPPKQSNQ